MCACNQYFRDLLEGDGEQDLVEDLLIECIQIYGQDCIYCPYEFVNEDKIYGEDTLLQYTKGHDLEMYIESVNGFEGQNDFLSKFGMQQDRSGNLMVSIRRFRQATNYTLERPREKDLIYFPLVDSIFEIKFVNHEKIFHQLGALPVYSLRIDLFNYNNQRIRTGIRVVDKFENIKGFVVDFQLATGGTSRFILGEMAYQGPDLANATSSGMVVSYDRTKLILTLKDIKGKFTITDGPIIGATSGANFTIQSFDKQELPTDPIADNQELTKESQVFVNWSEKNPFNDD